MRKNIVRPSELTCICIMLLMIYIIIFASYIYTYIIIDNKDVLKYSQSNLQIHEGYLWLGFIPITLKIILTIGMLFGYELARIIWTWGVIILEAYKYYLDYQALDSGGLIGFLSDGEITLWFIAIFIFRGKAVKEYFENYQAQLKYEGLMEQLGYTQDQKETSLSNNLQEIEENINTLDNHELENKDTGIKKEKIDPWTGKKL